MLNKEKYKDELEEILVTELVVRKGNGEIVTNLYVNGLIRNINL